MSENGRVLAPTADEVERRFRSPAVVVTRPAIIGAVGMLRVARRFGWHSNGIGHLSGDGKSMLFAANHQSHVDTAAILGTLPRKERNRTFRGKDRPTIADAPVPASDLRSAGAAADGGNQRYGAEIAEFSKCIDGVA